jgi:hypothetical protein
MVPRSAESSSRGSGRGPAPQLPPPAQDLATSARVPVGRSVERGRDRRPDQGRDQDARQGSALSPRDQALDRHARAGGLRRPANDPARRQRPAQAHDHGAGSAPLQRNAARADRPEQAVDLDDVDPARARGHDSVSERPRDHPPELRAHLRWLQHARRDDPSADRDQTQPRGRDRLQQLPGNTRR